MRKALFLLATICFCVGDALAQDDYFGPETTKERVYIERKVFIGLGLGLEYGGLGGNVSARPIPRLKLHGGCGYNVVGVAFNGGAGFRLMPKQKACITLGLMYGFNAATFAVQLEQFNKTYNGLTFTTTVELHGKYSNSHWALGLNISFWSPEFTTALGEIIDNQAVQGGSLYPLPLSLAVGYNFGL